MSEYLVQWKFGAGSTLNPSNAETQWYYQFHSDKIDAVNHFTELLFHASPAMKVTARIFELVDLMKNESTSEDVVEGPEDIPDSIKNLVAEVEHLDRNSRIMKMNEKGYSTREIATQMDLSYQTVYGVIRKMKG